MITLHKSEKVTGQFVTFQKQILEDFNDNNQARAAAFVLISILDNQSTYFKDWSIPKLLKKLNLTNDQWRLIQKILIDKGYLQINKTHIKSSGVWMHTYSFFDKSQLSEVPKLEKRKRTKKEKLDEEQKIPKQKENSCFTEEEWEIIHNTCKKSY